MSALDTPHLRLRELERALHRADPSALLISPRVLRRIIRVDRHLTTIGWEVPHQKTYFLSRTRLLDAVTRLELGLELERKLPERVILLERPDEEDLLLRAPEELLRDYWRLLFHIRVHAAFEQAIAAGQLTESSVLERLRELGPTQYAEARQVLGREDLLLAPQSEVANYVEFAATFLELSYFAPDQLAWWFPAVGDREAVLRQLGREINHAALYGATRLEGAAEAPGSSREETPDDSPPTATTATDPLLPSPPDYWRLIPRAERVGALGNVVKAAILRTKAARLALPERVADCQRAARAELERLAKRLQPVLELSDDETREWSAALVPLLENADQGLRAIEARLLYDLQKVCVEHERGVYKLDVWEWLRSWGRVPIRRPLPLLRQTLVTRHLQAAAKKLAAARLGDADRERLNVLITAAAHRARHHLRDRLRPQVSEALIQVGFVADNVPEKVAFRKIVEELLDRIVDLGHLNLGQLRDTFSRNDLKFRDLTSLWELLTGDLLLRADRRLSQTLDGVYHRGPIYLRWSQRLSASAFGTPYGRQLTRYVALPFGGAYLILESLRHVVHLFVPSPPPPPRSAAIAGEAARVAADVAAATTDSGILESPVLQPGGLDPGSLDVGALEAATTAVTAPAAQPAFVPQPVTIAQVVLLGIFLLMLIEHEPFRNWFLDRVRRLGQRLWRALHDLPLAILRWPWLRRLFDSPLYIVFLHYFLKPLLLTTLVVRPYESKFGMVSWVGWGGAFLVVNLLVNSPLGRFVEERISERLRRGWRELQLRVFSAAIQAILDLFQRLLDLLERVLYTVDEWLRFRRGESAVTLLVKIVLGAIWSVITYLVRIYITLLVEPQVNPIKHFPVVTVSHKMILPFSIQMTQIVAAPLAPLGTFLSTTIAGATVFLLPGVFGFLVWELKENWRLYAANRSRKLRPIVIGSHGENLLRFLRLGFHSGTLPRLFGKLRHAAGQASRTGKWNQVHRLQDSLHHLEESLHHFLERGLFALLEETPQWPGIPLRVGHIRLANHRVALEVLGGEQSDTRPLLLEFQERAGWIVASVSEQGWLSEQPEQVQRVFRRALDGTLHAAGTDILWEQVVKFVGFDSTWYDVSPDGILFWPHPKQDSAVLYRLRDTGIENPWPTPIRTVVVPSRGERSQLLYRESAVTWNDWVSQWGTATNPQSVLPVPQSQSPATLDPRSSAPPTAGP